MSLVLPGMVAWILTLAFDVLLTGGFHLDALADTAEDFSSLVRRSGCWRL